MQKNKVGPLPHTTYKNELKMNPRSKWRNLNDKTLRRKHRYNLCDLQLGNNFLYMICKAQAIKGKMDKLEFIKI